MGLRCRRMSLRMKAIAVIDVVSQINTHSRFSGHLALPHFRYLQLARVYLSSYAIAPSACYVLSEANRQYWLSLLYP
jgi:hypothetical protein